MLFEFWIETCKRVFFSSLVSFNNTNWCSTQYLILYWRILLFMRGRWWWVGVINRRSMSNNLSEENWKWGIDRWDELRHFKVAKMFECASAVFFLKSKDDAMLSSPASLKQTANDVKRRRDKKIPQTRLLAKYKTAQYEYYVWYT